MNSEHVVTNSDLNKIRLAYGRSKSMLVFTVALCLTIRFPWHEDADVPAGAPRDVITLQPGMVSREGEVYESTLISDRCDRVF